MIYCFFSFIVCNIATFVPTNAKSLVHPKSIVKLPIQVNYKLFSNVSGIRETPKGTKSSTMLNMSPITNKNQNTEIGHNQVDDRLSYTRSTLHATQSQYEPSPTPSGLLRKKFPRFQWHQVPNYLTYCRCVSVPILIWSFHLPDKNVVTCIIFAMASLTDYLDGYLARKWNVSSDFGAFLDPVADKLMVSTALILLAGRYSARVVVPACIILGREIAVSALREWMASRGIRNVVQVGYQGKIKTATTMVCITLLLLVPNIATESWAKIREFSFFLLYLSTLITITSAASYFRAAAPHFLNNERIKQ